MLRPFSGLVLAAALLSAAESPAAFQAGAGGWQDLTTLKGWTRVPIPKTAALNPEDQWKYDPRMKTIICEGDKGHEMLRSNTQYKDFVLHVEWRLKKTEGEPRYNSGVFARASADGEYFTQAQVGKGPAVWLFADYPQGGKKHRVNLRDQMTAERVRPPGEWNVYEITAKGPVVSLWVNGATIGQIDNVPSEPGYIGLGAEGFYIEFRNVQVKALR